MGAVHPTLGHPSCGTGFGENSKTIMPSSDWCILLHEELQAMAMVPLNSHVLCLHGQGLTSPGHEKIN